MQRLNMILFYCCCLLFILITDGASGAAVNDTIFPNQTHKDGDTIVSAGGIFELGFFSPGNSSMRYLGIWYTRSLLDASSMLKISDEGSLQLLSLRNTLVWSSPSYKLATNSNPVAQLLETGNLVIRDEVSNNISWQSFDHPGDTWLPGMKIGVDLVTGIHMNLTSWKTSNNPSLGSYTVWMDTNGYPHLFYERDDVLESRIGYWNGLGFSGVLSLRPNNLNAFDFVVTDIEIYTILVTNTFVTRMILDPQGNLV
ncbi:putative bulb-type lectin domain-containing protein [Helianthus annuus]|nr:putative bulb-type lectin domain-containing protein [Helianthus annuus]